MLPEAFAEKHEKYMRAHNVYHAVRAMLDENDARGHQQITAEGVADTEHTMRIAYDWMVFTVRELDTALYKFRAELCKAPDRRSGE